MGSASAAKTHTATLFGHFSQKLFHNPHGVSTKPKISHIPILVARVYSDNRQGLHHGG
jgi:hypothetical protein